MKANGHMDLGGTNVNWKSTRDNSMTVARSPNSSNKWALLKEIQMYNTQSAKDKSAHNRKTMSVTVNGPWPIYDDDNDKQFVVRGNHHNTEKATNRVQSIIKQRDAKRMQMELHQQIADKSLREANQRIFLDAKQLATNGQVMAQISPHLFEARAGDLGSLLKHDE